MSVKIWWVVPVLVVLAWQLRDRSEGRSLRRVLAGAAVVFVAADGPFFAAAPASMWHMVVLDQLGRPTATTPLHRAAELAGLDVALPGLRGTALIATLLLLTAVALCVVAAASSSRHGRLFVVLALAQVAVLALSPSYFGYYSGYPAGSFALVVAAAAGRPGAFRIPVAALCAGALAVTGTALRSGNLVSALPASRLARAADTARCVMSDTPMALIAMNVLSTGLANGCPNWVDVTGRTYGVDAPVSAAQSRRPDNLRWQRDITAYLLSGDATIAVRGNTGLAPAARRTIDALPVLARSGGWTLYRVLAESSAPPTDSSATTASGPTRAPSRLDAAQQVAQTGPESSG